MRKVLSSLLVLLMILSLVGCSSKGIYTKGTYTSSAMGMGEITVEVTVDANKVKEIKANLENETPSIGQVAGDELVDAIIKAQSADVDTVAGATITSKAIIEAVENCLKQARGEKEEDAVVKMQPGTYTSSASGFSYVEKVPVTVTVDETSILSVEVSEECSETTIMLRSAVKETVPEILKNQSVKVDGAIGATLSSNAIKTAVENCLVEALTSAGSDSSAIKAFYKVPEKAESKEVTLDTDVVVVGLGGAGMNALASVQEAGLKVIGIEKADKVGGTSVVTSAPMAVNPETAVVNNDGVELVDKEALKEAWLEYTTGEDGIQDAKEELVDVMLNESGLALDWLVNNYNFTFGEPHGGMTAADHWVIVYDYIQKSMVPNNRRIAVQDLYDKMIEKVVEKGGEVYTGTEGTELIYDKDTNTVTGIKAVGKDGTNYTINAKAVVLCTGGFAGNTKMVDEYITQNEYYDFSNKGGWRLYGCYQNDGKMLASAIENGAATYNIDMPPMVHNTATPKIMTSMEVLPAEGTEPITGRPATMSLNDVPQIMSDSANILAVGNNGKRFVNEAEMGVLGSWGNGNQFYSIWSTTQIDDIKENGFKVAKVSRYLGQGGWPLNTPVENIYEAIDNAIDLGIAYKADTLAELAEMIGVPAENLEETVKTYNEYCANGVDEEFGKDPQYLVAVEEGPYYCFVGAPWCYATCGGLDVNESLNVLDVNGNEIKGLYACGEDSLGTLMTNEKAYVTYGGAAQGWAITSGYYVGKVLKERLG